MKITRACNIELTKEEVAQALTNYVHEKYRYRSDSDAPKSWEECLNYHITKDGVTITWGRPLEPEEETVVANEKDEPVVYNRGELAKDTRDEHAHTL